MSASSDIARREIERVHGDRKPKLVFVVVAFECPVVGDEGFLEFEAAVQATPCTVEELDRHVDAAGRLLMLCTDKIVAKVCEIGDARLVERELRKEPKP